MPRRWMLTLVVGAGTLAVSGLLILAFDLPIFLLALPLFLPFAWGPRSMEIQTRQCPRCAWSTRDPGARFCAMDAQPLVEAPKRF